MDRNSLCYQMQDLDREVATREGGVDRNAVGGYGGIVHNVATREGGVDRNQNTVPSNLSFAKSPPARVAWIETPSRTESPAPTFPSPPARVAWIETNKPAKRARLRLVATREGGVDRNCPRATTKTGGASSPPARVAWIETFLGIEKARLSRRRHPRGWRG